MVKKKSTLKTPLSFNSFADLEISKETIADLAKRLYAAEKDIVRLKKDIGAREDWLRGAKSAAGYDNMTNFNDVWRDALRALRLQRKAQKM